MKITQLVPDSAGVVAWPMLSANRKSVVTIGVFDGMHRGHQEVIHRTVELARQSDSFAVVIMCDPRPGLVHAYAKAHGGAPLPQGMPDPHMVSGVRDRLRLMRELGVDHVLMVRYTLEFAAKSYRFFLGQLVGKLGMRTFVLGRDAALGAQCAGDVKAISTLSQATGVFTLDVVDDRGPGYVRIPADFMPVVPQGEGEPADPLDGMDKAQVRAWSKRHQCREHRLWSSTNVRYLLSQGRVRAANEILGHDHAVEGVVVHGEQRGRTIGFPTANVGQTVEGYVPVDGVYAGWLVDMGDDEGSGFPPQAGKSMDDQHIARDGSRMVARSPWRYPAAISIGTKPTFSEETGLQERVIEAYAITDDWLELYGHRVRVEFCGFLRPQEKFTSVDALQAALTDNARTAKRMAEES